MRKEIDAESAREGEKRPMVLRMLIFSTLGVAVFAFAIYFIVISNQPG